MRRTVLLLTLAAMAIPSSLVAQATYPNPVDGAFVARGFVFASGDRIPEIKIHYRAIEDYNPAPHLSKITAPLLAINSADDFVNPPELRLMQDLIKQVRKGRFVLLPITDATRGHGTHSIPAIWGPELVKFISSLR